MTKLARAISPTSRSNSTTLARLVGFSQPVPTNSVIFRENEPGYDYDWHVAPPRQFIVLLDGAIEIEASDGEKRTFRGGEARLMEDVSGRGHRTRSVEARRRRSLFITLEETTFSPEHKEET